MIYQSYDELTSDPSNIGKGPTGCPHCDNQHQQHQPKIEKSLPPRRRSFINNTNINKINYNHNIRHKPNRTINSGR